jgi:hypothetical protein
MKRNTALRSDLHRQGWEPVRAPFRPGNSREPERHETGYLSNTAHSDRISADLGGSCLCELPVGSVPSFVTMKPLPKP